jgi:hypothetical protein
MTRHLLLAVLPVVALVLAACGSEGTYELRWTIGCKTVGQSDCQVRSMKDCSRRGIDSVEVFAGSPGSTDRERSIFPCFSPDDGPVGRGPGLGGGEKDLTVYGLSAGGVRLTDAALVGAQIPEEGLVEVSVDIPEPPQCRDGVDNDLDGMVDLFDTDCVDANDTDESS